MKTKLVAPIILLSVFMLAVSLACTIPIIGDVTISKPPKSGDDSSAGSAQGSKVTTLTDVHKAVIQIEAQGTFLDPEVGLEVNAAGRGSGFIIDPSGIAVTNNHVVTGAALVKVWVNGETEPRNARVLGYSECNDLAVIKIDGSDFSYLDWYDGEIETGMEIYLAGFPLGEPEFSLTKGIVSKSHTSGDTSWTAITGGVIAHDATSNPGNSGGPLVNSDGKVVGVNFASRADANQYFAISADTARGVVEKLRTGVNFESIGVNGTIVSSEDGSITGVWVSSVASGSPADKTGLKPGDIITQMEGLVVGTDGTMSDYCSIIRTHDENSTLSLTVLRWSTQEILEGQLNGRELKATGSLQGNVGGSSGDSATSSGGNTTVDSSLSDYSTFVYGSEPENPDEIQFFMQDEHLHVYINGDYWPYLVYDPMEFSNVTVSTVVENSPVQEQIKLICRYDPSQGYYEFKFDSDGYYKISLIQFGGDLVDLTDFESTDKVNTGATDQYAAVCDGNTLSMYIDGELIASVQDSHLSSGKVGVGASTSASDPLEAVFDSITFDN